MEGKGGGRGSLMIHCGECVHRSGHFLMEGKLRKFLENLACVVGLVLSFSSFILVEGSGSDNDSKMLEGAS